MKNKILIIAEAGVNHNGSLERALKMVDEAKKAGADIIKFQTGKPKNLVSKFAKKAEYQVKNTKSNESQLKMLEKLLLSDKEFVKIKNYCDKKKIKFLSTPFDLESIDFLRKLKIDFFKIPSGEITNYPYLVKIGKTKMDVVMSTGMSNIKEIKDAIKVLKDNGTKRISLLHCNTDYPTKFSDVNLNAMLSLKKLFKVEVGYSDHTNGIEVSVAAAALGAKIIEKHFTLDKTLSGPDHKASLEPKELTEMINAIRNIEVSLGDGFKKPSKSELKNVNVARKSIVAKTNIKKGEKFSLKNITTKRPGTGLSPMMWEKVIGKVAKKNFNEDEPITL